jgi:hypothetical protein
LALHFLVVNIINAQRAPHSFVMSRTLEQQLLCNRNQPWITSVMHRVGEDLVFGV